MPEWIALLALVPHHPENRLQMTKTEISSGNSTQCVISMCENSVISDRKN